MAGKRVQWTDFEQDTLYAGTVDILKNKPKMKLLEAFNMAQVALPENRRRKHVRGPSQLTRELRERFILNGYLPKDWLGKKNVQAQDQKPDPRDTRIEQLQTLLRTTEEKVEQLEQSIEEQRKHIEWLKAQPGPMEVIQKWVANTLAMALISAEDAKKPAAMRVAPPVKPSAPPPSSPPPPPPEPLPAFERERRKDPGPRQDEEDADPRKKIALVAEFNNDAEISRIHEEVRKYARMRYLNSLSKLDNLGTFASSGGKVIVWNDRLPHGWKNKIASQGVLFRYCNGTPNNVVECIKEEAGVKVNQ